ncbi:ATP-binding protein [Streptomyces griseus]|uniref:ATP-binding protein n=1 Tax=Streptomyces griseus TaxID=1911 RepID=UPI003818097B
MNGAPLIHLSSFLGRADELVEVGRLLQGGLLVTLTGPAGVGKTRLALEAAGQAQRGRRLHPVVVPMRRLTGTSDLRQHVMGMLGEAEDPTGHRAAEPASSGGNRLLVLDDCEHMLEECGELLVQLLPRLPGLKALATSREPLRLPGETVFSVPALAVPGEREDGALAECLHSDAVRLFLDRTRAVAPEFQLAEANAAQVAEICRRLDGLPLAIEMAARLMGVFPLAEIVGRLDDPLSVLTSGWRLADDRQQSLRASLAWGYDLLDPAEQSLFRRLSVLPGGFGADAAAALADPGGAASEVPGLLVTLHAKSLIVPSAGEDGCARFRLLECMRCYGHERLVAEGEDAETYERLTARLTSLSSPLLEQAAVEPAVMRTLVEEHGNLTHLLGRADPGADERRLLLAGALAAAELDRGPSKSAASLVANVLGRGPETSPYGSVALEGAASFAAWRGDLGSALQHAACAVAVERDYGRAPLLGRLLLMRSGLRAMAGQRDGAEEDLRECLELARHLGDDLLTALCLGGFAWQRLQDGEPASAERTIVHVLPCVRGRVLPQQLRMTLLAAGVLALEQGDLPAAEAHFTESLRGRAASPFETVVAVEGLAVAAATALRFERALQLTEAAMSIGPGISWSWPRWQERVRRARSKALEELPDGRVEAALTAGRAMRGGHVIADIGKTGGAGPATGVDTPLSKREQDVVGLVVQGLSNRQIAARMHVSVRTVETHLRHIRTTLGLRSRAHVAAWAAEMQIAAPAIA